MSLKILVYFLKTKEMLTRIQPERNNTALLLKGENSFATHIGLVLVEKCRAISQNVVQYRKI